MEALEIVVFKQNQLTLWCMQKRAECVVGFVLKWTKTENTIEKLIWL